MYKSMMLFWGGISFFSFFLLFLINILMVFLIMHYVGLWNLFKKANMKGWMALIPFYNKWILVKISGLNWWYFLIIVFGLIFDIFIDKFDNLALFASLIASFFCYFNISKKFHKDIGYAILMTFFTFIMFFITGISKECVWDDDVVVSPNGPILNNYNDKNVKQNYDDFEDANISRYCTNCGRSVARDSKYCPNCGNEIK